MSIVQKVLIITSILVLRAKFIFFQKKFLSDVKFLKGLLAFNFQSIFITKENFLSSSIIFYRLYLLIIMYLMYYACLNGFELAELTAYFSQFCIHPLVSFNIVIL